VFESLRQALREQCAGGAFVERWRSSSKTRSWLARCVAERQGTGIETIVNAPAFALRSRWRRHGAARSGTGQQQREQGAFTHILPPSDRKVRLPRLALYGDLKRNG